MRSNFVFRLCLDSYMRQHGLLSCVVFIATHISFTLPWLSWQRRSQLPFSHICERKTYRNKVGRGKSIFLNSSSKKENEKKPLRRWSCSWRFCSAIFFVFFLSSVVRRLQALLGISRLGRGEEKATSFVSDAAWGCQGRSKGKFALRTKPSTGRNQIWLVDNLWYCDAMSTYFSMQQQEKLMLHSSTFDGKTKERGEKSNSSQGWCGPGLLWNFAR